MLTAVTETASLLDCCITGIISDEILAFPAITQKINPAKAERISKYIIVNTVSKHTNVTTEAPFKNKTL